MKGYEKVGKNFFSRRATEVAEDLLGAVIENTEDGTSGVIVETEAYLGEKDPSCHLARNREERNKVFYQGPGTVYVFKIYNHHNLNFITEKRGYPEGVLIRAIKPLNNIGLMRKRRKADQKKEIGSGPGKLTEALNITKEHHNNQNLSESSISIYKNNSKSIESVKTRRIGISEAEDWPLRFHVEKSPYISRKSMKSGCSFNPDKFYQEL